MSPQDPHEDIQNTDPNGADPAKKFYKKHDSVYHRFFSYPLTVEMLLTSFVPDLDTTRLDFSTLKPENAKVHSEDLNKRRGDVLFSIQRINQGQPPTPLMLSLEFQSRPHPSMPFRLLEYTSLLYQRWKSTGYYQTGAFPEILTFVLYNGRYAWHVPDSVWGYLAQPASPSRVDSPQVRYRLIDVRRYSHKVLEAINNPVAWFMQLDKGPLTQKLLKCMGKKINAWTDRPAREPIRDEFTIVCTELGRQSQANKLNWDVTDFPPSKEAHPVGIAENMDRFVVRTYLKAKKEGLKEGLEVGIEKGIEKGIEVGRKEERQQAQEAVREAVKAFLTLKFGQDGLDIWKQRFEGVPLSYGKKILAWAQEAQTFEAFKECVQKADASPAV